MVEISSFSSPNIRVSSAYRSTFPKSLDKESDKGNSSDFTSFIIASIKIMNKYGESGHPCVMPPCCRRYVDSASLFETCPSRDTNHAK